MFTLTTANTTDAALTDWKTESLGSYVSCQHPIGVAFSLVTARKISLFKNLRPHLLIYHLVWPNKGTSGCYFHSSFNKCVWRTGEWPVRGTTRNTLPVTFITRTCLNSLLYPHQLCLS